MEKMNYALSTSLDDLSEKMEELVGDANIIFEECHALLETIPPKYFPPARPDSDSKD